MRSASGVMSFGKRLASLKRRLSSLDVDALLVSNNTNVSYMTGFGGHDSMLLVTPDRQFFLTDSRYLQEARETVERFSIRLVRESAFATIADIAADNRIKRLGFESMHVPYGVFAKLSTKLPKIKLVPTCDAIGAMREIKEPAEVLAIKRSIRLTKSVFRKALGILRPGISELSLARFISAEFLKEGAQEAFESIVAAGESSSRPHSRPGARKIRRDSFVMIDMGSRKDGYCSDMTRTVAVGALKDRFVKIYRIVRDAQKRAIEKIRDGARISAVDFAARGYIHSKGYGKCFGHSVGHGVGLDIHEGPSVSRNNGDLLRGGMVITVEPAIYLPGFGGVRIEDMVLVKNDGYEILT